jgi:hypothetical protein
MRARAISPDIVIEVFEYMRKHKLALADLAELGGEDLRHSNPAIVKRARAVERTWERMAAAGLRFVDLEQFASQPANFRRYPKQLRNQRLAKGVRKPPSLEILQQDQTLKNLPPSPRRPQPEKPALGTAAAANSAQGSISKTASCRSE